MNSNDIMEALAAKAALTIGAEAIRLLNRWLENEETARAWFGPDHRVFARRSPWTLWQSLKIRRVFVVTKEDWELVISLCLSECYNWYSDRDVGHCSWLPLYRTLTSRSNGTQFIKNARAAPYSIGTVASLPAACIDKWGLVVLASADGGTPRVLQDGEGAYRAIFEGRDFTLVIRQESLNSMTVAHLSPKRHPSENIHRLTEAEWKNLLNRGRSLGYNDPTIQWLDDHCIELPDPPQMLVDGEYDNAIKKYIFDYLQAGIIRGRLQAAIYACHDCWEGLQNKASTNQLGNESQQFVSDKAWRMKRNLMKMKMLLQTGSWNSFCEEMTPADVLHYAQRQYDLVKDSAQILGDDSSALRRHHARILACQKLLCLSSIIPQHLSTRGTDATVLLV